MTCSSCSGAVESALAGLPGVAHAAVSLTLQAGSGEAGRAVCHRAVPRLALAVQALSSVHAFCLQEAKVEYDPQLDEVRLALFSLNSVARHHALELVS